MNLEALRQKRIKRLNVKNAGFTGQRRIFFILDRGTRKFKDDIGLWMQYIEHARKQKSSKKLAQIFTSVLRLHPAKPELWIFAARYAMDENADMMTARSYMQRGLRFNKQSRLLWLEYAKLEMNYVAKIAARQQILGLNEARPQTKGDTEDMMALPDVTAEDFNADDEDEAVDEEALRKLAKSPALTGAIPIAIFDAATQQFPKDDKLPAQFLSMFAEFDRLSCLDRLLEQVLDYTTKAYPTSAWTAICKARRFLVGVNTASAEFPAALGHFLSTINEAMEASPRSSKDISEQAIRCLLPLLHTQDLGEATQRVLSASVRKFCLTLEEHVEQKQKSAGGAVVDFATTLQKAGQRGNSRALAKIAVQIWPANDRLEKIAKGSDG